MPAIDEVQLPKSLAYGSTFGPGFNTSIMPSAGGQEQRVARWSMGHHSGDLASGVKSAKDMDLLKAFYMARRGALRGWRFSDPSDFSTGANSIGPPGAIDQVLGVGDGTTVTFQLVKRYVSGGQTYVRKLNKPVDGTTKIAVDGSLTAAGVDTTTGLITLGSPPTALAVVTGGCEFDVPCRFDKVIDTLLAISYDDYKQLSVKSIPIVEIQDDKPAPEDFNFGGADEFVLTADLTISPSTGRVITLQTALSGRSVYLPDPADLPAGMFWFLIFNHASPDITIRDSLGNPIVVLTHDTSAEVALSLAADNTTRTWYSR